jgi:hypothetical protein
MKKTLGDEFSFFGNGDDTLLPTAAAVLGFAAKPAEPVFAPGFLGPTNHVVPAGALTVSSFGVAASNATLQRVIDQDGKYCPAAVRWPVRHLLRGGANDGGTSNERSVDNLIGFCGGKVDCLIANCNAIWPSGRIARNCRRILA